MAALGEVSVVTEMQDVINDLRNALAYANLASRPGAPPRDRVQAARIMHRALRRLTDSDDLWGELTARAMQAPYVDGPVSHALVERLADLFARKQAALLTATGYQDQPPPSAFDLLADMRCALPHPIGRGPAGPITPETLSHIRVDLREFVDTMGSRAPRSQSRPLRRWLGRARTVTVAASGLEAESVTVGMQGPMPTIETTFKRASAEGVSGIAEDLHVQKTVVDAFHAMAAVRQLQETLLKDQQAHPRDYDTGAIRPDDSHWEYAAAISDRQTQLRASLDALAEAAEDAAIRATRHLRPRKPCPPESADGRTVPVGASFGRSVE